MANGETPVSKGIGTGKAQVLDIGPSESSIQYELGARKRAEQEEEAKVRRKKKAQEEALGKLNHLDDLDFWYNRDSDRLQKMYQQYRKWGDTVGWKNIANDPTLQKRNQDIWNDLKLQAAKSGEDKATFKKLANDYKQDKNKPPHKKAYSSVQHDLLEEWSGSEGGAVKAREVKRIIKENGQSLEKYDFISEDTKDDELIRVEGSFLASPNNERVQDAISLALSSDQKVWDESMIKETKIENEEGITVSQKETIEEDIHKSVTSWAENNRLAQSSLNQKYGEDLSLDEQVNRLTEDIYEKKTQEFFKKKREGDKQEIGYGDGFYRSKKGYVFSSGMYDLTLREFFGTSNSLSRSLIEANEELKLDEPIKKIIDISRSGEQGSENIGEFNLYVEEEGVDVNAIPTRLVKGPESGWMIRAKLQEKLVFEGDEMSEGDVLITPYDNLENKTEFKTNYGIKEDLDTLHDKIQASGGGPRQRSRTGEGGGELEPIGDL